MDNLALVKKAIEARQNAYAPYSNHRVGAAVECEDGTVFVGCNVENCALPLGDCAERVTLYKAVSEGHTQFKKLAVVTGNEEISPPCGACRQVIREFCTDLEIIVSNPNQKIKTFTLKELLPNSFGPEELKKGQDA